MADSVIGLPADGPGKSLDAEQLAVAANTVQRQRNQVAGAGALEIARVINSMLAGTEYGLVTRGIVQGGLPPAITGTFLSTSAVGSVIGGDVSQAGNLFAVISGTYGANAVVAFEASVDSTNPASGNWFLYPGNRINSVNVESQNPAGAVAANAVMAWEFAAGAIIGFRVRLVTVPASGTINVRINTGTIPYEPTPVATLGPVQGRVNLFGLVDRVTAVTTEALASFLTTKAGVQATASTQYTVTAGRTLHIAALFMVLRNQTTATVVSARARLRQAAAVSASSAIIEAMEVGWPMTSGVVEGAASMAKPTDVDVPGSQQIGISHVANSSSATVTVGWVGYEY